MFYVSRIVLLCHFEIYTDSIHFHHSFRVRILHQNQLAAKGLAARLGRQIQVAPKVHGALGGKVSGPQLMTTKPIYSMVISVGEVYQIRILKGSLRN